jgi:hypothetical protein
MVLQVQMGHLVQVVFLGRVDQLDPMVLQEMMVLTELQV